jgi:hypothetical protein
LELTIEILKYAFPLIGVCIGWILTQLTEKNKAAREDKRKVKKTLYYLLEVRYQLSLYCLEEAEIGMYLTIVKKKFSHYSDISQLDDAVFKAVIEALLKQIIGEKPLLTDSEIQNLNANYLKCIDTLSEVDPILAFKLDGRQNIKTLLKEAIERTKGLQLSELTQNQNDVEHISEVFSKLEPNLLKQVLLDIEDIMLSLAKKVDSKTHKGMQARLATKRTPQEMAELEKTVDNLFAGLLNPANISSSR